VLDGKAIFVTRCTAFAVLTAIVVLTLVPPGFRPEFGLPHVAEHVCIFLVAGAAFAAGYPHIRYAMVVAAVPLTGALEALQVLVPGRHARISDFAINTLAFCAPIVIAELHKRVFSAQES
jgi:hypothetical protein